MYRAYRSLSRLSELLPCRHVVPGTVALKMDPQGVHENRSRARARGGRGAQVRIWRGALGLIIGGVATCCAVGLPAQFWHLCNPR